MKSSGKLTELQEEFLSHVSHEFRSPLTAVIGYMDLLLRPGEKHSPRHQQYLESMKRGVTRLSQFIDNLMDMTELESGHLQFLPEPADVKEALEAVVVSLHEDIAAFRQLVTVDVREGLCVWADPDQFRKIIFQVLSNAIKFTPDGGRIELWAKPEGSAIHMGVTDSGVGIPPAEQERIFDRFYQVSETRNRARKTTGTGLGLTIARCLVERQGGKIRVEKSSAKGSTVAWTLPKPAAASVRPARSADVGRAA